MGTNHPIMKATAALMMLLLAFVAAEPAQIKRRAHVDPRDFAMLAESMSAEPEKESTEDFEIQCATSCKFVPRSGAAPASFLETGNTLSAKNTQMVKVNPKHECYKVCHHPKVGAGETEGGAKNCVRLCVQMLRMLSYRLANKWS